MIQDSEKKKPPVLKKQPTISFSLNIEDSKKKSNDFSSKNMNSEKNNADLTPSKSKIANNENESSKKNYGFQSEMNKNFSTKTKGLRAKDKNINKIDKKFFKIKIRDLILFYIFINLVMKMKKVKI